MNEREFLPKRMIFITILAKKMTQRKCCMIKIMQEFQIRINNNES